MALRCRLNFDRGLRYHREWIPIDQRKQRRSGTNARDNIAVMKDTPTRTAATHELRNNGDDESGYGFDSSYKMSSSANLNRMSID